MKLLCDATIKLLKFSHVAAFGQAGRHCLHKFKPAKPVRMLVTNFENLVLSNTKLHVILTEKS